MKNSRHTLATGLIILMLAVPVLDAEAQQAGSKPLLSAKQRFDARDDTNTRIIGGEPTDYKRNPWQVALLYAEDKSPARAQFCGGVIVHPRWVLTAAHCVDRGTRAEQVHVLSGTAHLRLGMGSRVEAEEIVVHPQWNPTSHDFDIALVRVKTPLKGQRIVPGADPEKLASGAKIWVSGWGVTDKLNSNGTDELQGVELDYIATATCNGPLSYGGSVTDNMFCAGVGEAGGGSQDSCQGDSGGPASIGPVASAKLVGLVSWGEDCTLKYKYGVYTKVANFLTWVKENSKGEVRW